MDARARNAERVLPERFSVGLKELERFLRVEAIDLETGADIQDVSARLREYADWLNARV